jgi:ABC-type antimicrobial peptide transport system permease subunit
MLKTYFVIAIRSLLKNKVYTILNLLGIATSLACATIGFLNYSYNRNFDSHIPDRSNTFRVYSTYRVNGEKIVSSEIPLEVSDQLRDNESMEGSFRYFNVTGKIGQTDNFFHDEIYFTDPEMFSAFQLELVDGDFDAFRKNAGILISESFAIKIFKNDNAINKLVELQLSGEKPQLLTVSGIYKDLPQNATLHFKNAIGNVNVFSDSELARISPTCALFFKAPPAKTEVSASILNKSAGMLSKKEVYKNLSSLWALPFNEIATESPDLTEKYTRRVLPSFISRMPLVIALTILLIASFNYVNCSIAVAGNRLKEIGIRKVLGTVRSNIILQFVVENLILCLITVIPALLITSLLLPHFNSLYYRFDYTLDLTDPHVVGFILALPLLTALGSGAYVAIYVSKFKPAIMLKGAARLVKNNTITFILLGCQLTLSVATIVLAYTFNDNSKYQREMDMGFATDGAVIVKVADKSEYDIFYNLIKTNTAIKSIVASNHQVGMSNTISHYHDGQFIHDVYTLQTGPRYATSMGMRFVAGEDFNEDSPSNSIVVNEKFLSVYKINNPFENEITLDSTNWKITGVIRDVLQNGTTRPMVPVVIMNFPVISNCVVNIQENASEGTLLAWLEQQWKSTFKQKEFSYHLQHDALKGERQLNATLTNITAFLAILSLLIGSSGFFATVSLEITNRKTEIGMRKLLGASLMQIVYTINRRMIILTLFCFPAGLIAGIMFSERSLKKIFFYYQEAPPLVYILPVVIFLLVITLTSGFHIYKAATVNPVKSLRSE